jgi:hypothetical protein
VGVPNRLGMKDWIVLETQEDAYNMRVVAGKPVQPEVCPRCGVENPRVRLFEPQRANWRRHIQQRDYRVRVPPIITELDLCASERNSISIPKTGTGHHRVPSERGQMSNYAAILLKPEEAYSDAKGRIYRK